MKRIFITGGAGFIGISVSEKLLLQGHTVIAIDKTKLNNQNLIANPNYKFKQIDMFREKQNLMQYMIHEKPDILLHLAYTADNDIPDNLPPDIANESLYIDDWLYNMTAHTEQCKEILLLSTHRVYGNLRKDTRVNEEFMEKPVTMYGKMKFNAEQSLIETANKDNICGIIIRTCPIYTSNYDINLSSKIIDENHVACIYGDGSYTFSFTALENLVKVIAAVADKEPSSKLQGIYNVADSKQYMASSMLNYFQRQKAFSDTVRKPKPPVFGGFGGEKNCYRYTEYSQLCNSIIYDNIKAAKFADLSPHIDIV